MELAIDPYLNDSDSVGEAVPGSFFAVSSEDILEMAS